jgi:hypothetical protein
MESRRSRGGAFASARAPHTRTSTTPSAAPSSRAVSASSTSRRRRRSCATCTRRSGAEHARQLLAAHLSPAAVRGGRLARGPRLVHDILPRLYRDLEVGSRMNVIDEDGRIVFGPPITVGEFTVGRPFPTTLYNWRLQVALTSAEELRQQGREAAPDRARDGASPAAVAIAGLVIVLVGAMQERRLAAAEERLRGQRVPRAEDAARARAHVRRAAAARARDHRREAQAVPRRSS